MRRSGLDGDDADELRYRLVEQASLSEDERTAVLLLPTHRASGQVGPTTGPAAFPSALSA